MGYAHGKRWTDEIMEAEVRAVSAEKFGGRMPSAPELNDIGLHSLANRISRTKGGYRGVAKKLALTLKDSETAFGNVWEDFVEGYLKAHGREVQRQTTRAPFDLLVDGHVRVNVKSARWHEYGPCKGFFFGLSDTWNRCDVFALVKVQDNVQELLWVPSREAQQQTITLTKKHRLNAFTSMEPLDAQY